MTMWTDDGRYIEMDDYEPEIHGNADAGYWVFFNGSNHGPFETFKVADDALNTMLREKYEEYS